jgi:ribosomal protein S18 acetylase RimI-like enzyme
VSTGYEVTLAEQPPEGARDAIMDVLLRYNEEHVGNAGRDRAQFAALVREPGTGAVLGGIMARAWREMLTVELVALPPELRGAGLGSRLMRMVEEEGRRRGCNGAWLQTSDWQARGFYEKLGYTIFGRLEDYPAGHTRFFMKKSLR